MRIRRAIIKGFGRLCNLEFEFGPGLNIVHGANESGKSTLHRFIRGLLYGFQRPGATRRTPTEDLAKYRPWSGNEYSGSLIYELDSGQAYRVERDFASDRLSARVFDEVTGADLTGEFEQDRRKEVLFAERHLGLSDGAFDSTACIGQLAAGQLELADELAHRLSNLGDSGREDISARDALGAIHCQLEEIGSERAPTRPYAKARQRVAELEAEQEEASRRREENLERESRRVEVLGEFEVLRAESRTLEARLASQRAASLRVRLERLRGERDEIARLEPSWLELEPYRDFREGSGDEVKMLGQSLAALGADISVESDRIRSLQAELGTAQSRLEPLRYLSSFEGSVSSELGSRYGRYQMACSESDEVRDRLLQSGELLSGLDHKMREFSGLTGRAADARDELARLETEILRLGSKIDSGRLEVLSKAVDNLRHVHQSQSNLWLGLALVLAALGALTGWLAGSQFYLAALLALPALFVWHQRNTRNLGVLREAESQLDAVRAAQAETRASLEARRGELVDLLGSTNSASPSELKARLAEYGELVKAWEVQSEQQRGLAQRERELAGAIEQNGALAREILSRGLEVAATAIQLSSEELADFEGRMAAYAELRAGAEELRHRLEDREFRQAEMEAKRDAATVRLKEILAAAGSESAEEYLRGCERKAEWLRLDGQIQGRREVIRGLLAGHDEEDLGRRLESLESGAGGATPEAGISEAELQAAIDRIGPRITALSEELSRLEGMLEESASRGREPVEIQADLDQARSQFGRFARLRRGLETARDILSEAVREVHREFAPTLNRRLGEQIHRLTGGAYSEVRVDRDLRLTVLVPETGQIKPISSLSAGTVDQIYLSLRLAAAQLLAEGNEKPPLLLDDSFVQTDDGRLLRAIEVLMELVSDGYQVFLFTCHRREVESAVSLAGSRGLKVLELTM